MTVTYIKSIDGGRVVVHSNANTGTITVAGSSSVSNLCSNNDEIVMSAGISKVSYGGPVDAYWVVKRGANLVGVYNGTGVADYSGALLKIDSTATITANQVGSTNGHIILELKKNV